MFRNTICVVIIREYIELIVLNAVKIAHVLFLIVMLLYDSLSATKVSPI
jgi:hypothetical protein